MAAPATIDCTVISRLVAPALGGADVFHFAGSFGADKILDYEDGRDQIMFKDYIRIDLDVDVVGGNTVITAIGGDSVTVLGFTGNLAFGTDIVFGP